MITNRPLALFAALLLVTASLTACNKQEKPQTVGAVTAGSIDTSEKVQEVALTDTNHHVYFRPKAGSTFRFHVADKIAASFSQDFAGKPMSQSGGTTTEYYIRETVKSINPDSTVDLVMHIDSVTATMTRDTDKTVYSSSKAADRNDAQFLEFNMIVGKDFTIRVTKYGDMDSILDVSASAKVLLATAPDSVRGQEKMVQLATQQAMVVANSYAMRVLAHDPTLKLVVDTTWKNSSEVPLSFAGLSFPVTVTASETVKPLEQRNNKVIVVLQDHSSTKPNKTTFEDAMSKATIGQFVAVSDGVVRLEDATGVVFHRLLEEKRDVTLTLESKQAAGQKRVMKQSSTENMVVEQLP